MPHASATAPASAFPLRSQRIGPSPATGPSTFADALTFAFDIAFRAKGSLSLAQRAAYGLERQETSDLSRRTQLVETPRPLRSTMKVDRSMMHQDAARRTQFGETLRPLRSTMKVDRSITHLDVASRAQLGEIARPLRSIMKVDRSTTHSAHPYFTFSARAGGAEVTFLVANGRAFAGVRSWTR